jgi:hypothetical protein
MFLSATTQAYTCHGLFIQPYSEAVHNLKNVGNSERSLLGRVAHLVLGLLLLFPLINTILMLFLRLCSGTPPKPETKLETREVVPIEPPPARTVTPPIEAFLPKPPSPTVTPPPELPAAAVASLRKILSPSPEFFEARLGTPPPETRAPAVTPEPVEYLPLPRTKLQRVVEPLKDELEGAKKEGDEEVIINFVDDFLFPYISGRITAETDPPDRPAMMNQLLDALRSQGKLEYLSEEGVTQFAFMEYLRYSCLGFYIHVSKIQLHEHLDLMRMIDDKAPIVKRAEPDAELDSELEADSSVVAGANLNGIDIRVGTAAFNGLVNALQRAIPKDFPSIQDLQGEELVIVLNMILEGIKGDRRQERELTILLPMSDERAAEIEQIKSAQLWSVQTIV